MLKSLSIRNYALIEALDISFGERLSILTGETGAGKSIILGALSLILGKRADTSVLMDNQGKCVIEGTFDVRPYGLKPVFNELDVDYEELTVVRREITNSGKSRAFINDTPVNLAGLKELVSQLIDIHSQHQTLEINSAEYQLQALDHYAGAAEEAEAFRQQYRHYRSLERELKTLIEREQSDKAQLEYIEYQFNELESAQLKEEEEEELESELNLLSHTEEVKQHLQTTIGLMDEGEVEVLSMLGEASHALQKAAGFMEQLKNSSERMESALIDLRDLVTELRNVQGTLSHDPERLEYLRQRMDMVNALQHKHKVSSIKELIELKNKFSDQLNGILDEGAQIEKLQEKCNKLRRELEATAALLMEKRAGAIPGMEEEITSLVRELGMKEAIFKIDHRKRELNENGSDEVLFLFSANKGISPAEMSKAASGGELSRLMLSLKSVIARKTALPTIVFDEIDTGISGEIADKTGGIIKRIAGGTQVICITHLPQMASKGDAHYLVYKDTSAQPPKTHIRLLSETERINEIAKMLSGETLTPQAIENAKVLLNA